MKIFAEALLKRRHPGIVKNRITTGNRKDASKSAAIQQQAPGAAVWRCRKNAMLAASEREVELAHYCKDAVRNLLESIQ
jgi:hypothetical protein